MGFSPFAVVVEGMDVVDKFYDGYSDQADQGLIQEQGAAYLKKTFPMMDYVKTAMIFDPAAPVPAVVKPAAPKAVPAVPVKPTVKK